MPQIQLVINRLRMDMIQRGEMMSIEDVTEILAVDLLGAIPDDEAVVIATNQGEPLCGKDSLSGKAFENICSKFQEKKSLLWISVPKRVFSNELPVFSKNNKGGLGMLRFPGRHPVLLQKTV